MRSVTVNPRHGRTAAGACASALALTVLAAPEALAGGFYAPYQSTSALGTALAGSSARADDPSFLFYNPAIMTALPGASVTVEARAYVPSIRIEASRALDPFGVDITAAGSSGSMSDPVAGPGFFAAAPLAKGLWLGFSGAAPFAVDIEADPGWAGRYQLLKTDMRGINFTAALAYQMTDWLSVSVGAQAQHFRGIFEKSELIPIAPPPVPPIEARGYLRGEDWAYGGVVGVLLTPLEGTRIGASYKSALTHNMKGTAGAQLPFIPEDSARFEIALPDILSVGLEQRINPSLRLFAEGQWVRWSRFKGFDISFGSGRPNEVRAQEWDNTWMAAIGLAYKVMPTTEITAGVHYDTAVTSGGANTLSPDGARTMVALGLTHDIAGQGRISAYYAHVFFEDAVVNVTSPGSGTLQGTFKGALDTFGLSYRMDW